MEKMKGIWLIATLLFAVACEKEQSSKSGSKDAVVQRAAELLCGTVSACCKDRKEYAGIYADAEECRTTFVFNAKTTFNEIEMDNDKVNECLALWTDYFEKIGCEGVVSREEFDPTIAAYVPPCSEAFRGTIKKGESCFFSAGLQPFMVGNPCADGLICSEDEENGSVCAEPNPCFLDCPVGQYCDGADRTCKPRKGLGDPCVYQEEVSECAYPNYCDGQKCVEPKKAGESCASEGDESLCGHDRCDKETQICVEIPGISIIEMYCSPRSD